MIWIAFHYCSIISIRQMIHTVSKRRKFSPPRKKDDLGCNHVLLVTQKAIAIYKIQLLGKASIPKITKISFWPCTTFYFNQHIKGIQLIDICDVIHGGILDISKNSILDFCVNNGILEEISFICMNKELNPRTI